VNNRTIVAGAIAIAIIATSFTNISLGNRGIASAIDSILPGIVSVASAATDNNLQQQQHRLKVIASFFPLYDFAKNIVGNKANVTVMVPIGSEPHDWEPTIQQVQEINSADVFIFNGAGIDKWAEGIKNGPKLIVNASEGLPLLRDSSGQADPHTWLDPVMAKQQVELIRDGIIKADPQNAAYYKQNAQDYLAKLDSLNSNFTKGLSKNNCNIRDFIAFHKAFTYFANRYNLTQHSLLGEDPEGEIAPQTLQQMIDLAKQHNIHVVYSEDLLDPRLANVIASSIPNGKDELLSPLEGLKPDEQKAGLGYIDKMEMNLANLRDGLQCK
jgi:zinc transport system substrate-binding protein